jgi:hypothetical protein
MRIGTLLPTVFAFAMFVAIPASTRTHAMSLVGGITKADDGLIASVAKHSCRHIRNRHQRHLCQHPKKPKRMGGRD